MEEQKTGPSYHATPDGSPQSSDAEESGCTFCIRGCGVVVAYMMLVVLLSYMPELVGADRTLYLGLAMLAASGLGWVKNADRRKRRFVGWVGLYVISRWLIFVAFQEGKPWAFGVMIGERTARPLRQLTAARQNQLSSSSGSHWLL